MVFSPILQFASGKTNVNELRRRCWYRNRHRCIYTWSNLLLATTTPLQHIPSIYTAKFCTLVSSSVGVHHDFYKASHTQLDSSGRANSACFLRPATPLTRTFYSSLPHIILLFARSSLAYLFRLPHLSLICSSFSLSFSSFPLLA